MSIQDDIRHSMVGPNKLPIKDAFLESHYRKLLEGNGLDKSDLKTIVNLEPTWEQAQEIAWPGGVEPHDLHATLCLIEYDERDMINLDAIRTTLQNLAYRGAALRGKISGWGCIGRPERPAWVALLSVLGLAELRSDLVRDLRKQGVAYAQDWDFLPHMTISYGEMPSLEALKALSGKELTFTSLVLRIKEEVELYPFSEAAFIEAQRTTTGIRRDTSRPGGGDWDPFLHPRNREGKFRNVANQIRDMQVGAQIDVFRFIKRAALPGVTSGRLIRTRTGYVLSIAKENEFEQYTHDGPMSKDELAALIGQAEEGLDFSNLSIEERRELGLPTGTRPGQNLTEEGDLRTESASPRVDAVVMEQNGGLTATGTTPENVTGNPDGEHWVFATWDPAEYEHYNLSETDRAYLASRRHAIAYRTEAGGLVQIEYFPDEVGARRKWDMLRTKHGAPPTTVRPNSDLAAPSAAVEDESSPSDSSAVSREGDLPSAPDAAPPDSGQPPAVETEDVPPSGAENLGPSPDNADDAMDEGPVGSAALEAPDAAPGQGSNQPGTPPAYSDPTTSDSDASIPPVPEVSEGEEPVSEGPSIEGLQPEPSGTSGDLDAAATDSADNEIYRAIQDYAPEHADGRLEFEQGTVYRVPLNFANTDTDPEQALGVDWKIEGSAEAIQDAYGAIAWPNGMVSLFTDPATWLSAWKRVEDATSSSPAEGGEE